MRVVCMGLDKEIGFQQGLLVGGQIRVFIERCFSCVWLC
jgi:xanthine/CO dehydrogenase XdhC/CoxF family maturation factor